MTNGTETDPLLPQTANSETGGDSQVRNHETSPESEETVKLRHSFPKFLIALTAVFIANADTSLVIATYGTIASQFQSLKDGPWLLTGYTLGYCVALPVYGTTSDAYGRKAPLLAACCLFCLGCIISGTATSLWQVIIGRVAAGTGGAGITAVVAIVITDVLPLRKVAAVRSYVNIAAVTGRSVGGPLGGLLIDSIGWRWSFLAQVPVIFVCFVLLLWQSLPTAEDLRAKNSKKRSLDFMGVASFAIFMSLVLFFLDYSSRDASLDQTKAISLGAASIAAAILFILTEAYWSHNPMTPPSLLKQAGVTAQYLMQVLLVCAQFAVVSNLAEYFIYTEEASNTVAALHIVPAPIGNALGALLAGQIINRTQKYKPLILVALALCTLSYLLITLRWHGHLDIWESLYIFPASLGIGMVNSAQFIGLSIAAPKPYMATAVSIFLLSAQVGLMLGASSSAALLKGTLRSNLLKRLGGVKGRDQIIDSVLNDTRYVYFLPEGIRATVIASYLRSFRFVAVLSLCSSVAALPFVIPLRELKLG